MSRRRAFGIALALSASAALASAAGVSAVTLEPIGSYQSPVYVTSDTNDENRVYVVEQRGRIQLTTAGGTSLFADLTDVVQGPGDPGAGGEQGLLSMAFAPDFHLSGRFYVAYTGNGAGDLDVAEMTATGDSADPATLRSVITVPHPGAPQNHNSGQLQFGPDGFLYVSTGDQGGSGAPAQNPGDLSGKLLRIAPTPGGGYEVPSDNPFVGVAGVRPEIWSLGLRNLWRFSFDRTTGDMLLADVGAGSREEVNYVTGARAGAGLNFGWPCREGDVAGPAGCAGAFTNPTFWYDHSASRCAITGGYVVRDPGVEELFGRYVYADLCIGQVRSQEPANPFATDRFEVSPMTGANTTSFGEDRCGRVYVTWTNGAVHRLVDGSPAFCPPPDRTGPGLGLGAKRRQKVKRHRPVESEAVSDESGRLDLSATITKGGQEKELFGLGPQSLGLQAGTPAAIEIVLSKQQARRCRRLIEKGRRVEVQLHGVATDAAGNAGAAAEAEVRLVAGK